MSQDVDLELVARDPRTQGFSGADLAALAREALAITLTLTLTLTLISS